MQSRSSDLSSGNLRLTVERAIDIPNSIFGTAATVDPYLKVRVDNSNHAERGMVKEHAGNNPVFNDSFMVNLKGQERGLSIEVWDENILKNTELAAVFVPIDDLCRKSGQSERYRLSTRKGDPAGEIVIRAQFDDKPVSQMSSGFGSSSWSSQPQQSSSTFGGISSGGSSSFDNNRNLGSSSGTAYDSGLGSSSSSNFSSSGLGSSSATYVPQQQSLSQQPLAQPVQPRTGLFDNRGTGIPRGEHEPSEPLASIMPNRDHVSNTGMNTNTNTYQQQPRNL